MKRTLMVTALAFSLAFVLTGCAAKKSGVAVAGCKKGCGKDCCGDMSKWTAFGEKMKTENTEPICADEILANKERFADKFVRVCGKIDSVCAHKGCWIRLKGPTGGETLFVKFTCPVSGRLVPMEAQGRLAIVEGTLKLSEITEDEARHYAEDSDASPEEIAKIVGPQKLINLYAPAARIDLTKKVASVD